VVGAWLAVAGKEVAAVITQERERERELREKRERAEIERDEEEEEACTGSSSHQLCQSVWRD
jgi:hypothetical protein